jgi:RNA polymerase sigma factor (sigma-70 family)
VGSGASGADDETLAGRVADGDQQALAVLYDRYGTRAYTLARRLCVDTQLAEDAVQEAFLALWKEPARFDPARGRFSSWLLTVVHHKAVDVVRAQSRVSRRTVSLTDDDLSLLPSAPSADEAIMAHADAGVVRAALTRLSPAQRQTLGLAFYGGYTQCEISTILAVPIGTVKSRTFAALAVLRQLLGASADSGLGRPARVQQ